MLGVMCMPCCKDGVTTVSSVAAWRASPHRAARWLLDSPAACLCSAPIPAACVLSTHSRRLCPVPAGANGSLLNNPYFLTGMTVLLVAVFSLPAPVAEFRYSLCMIACE